MPDLAPNRTQLWNWRSALNRVLARQRWRLRRGEFRTRKAYQDALWDVQQLEALRAHLSRELQDQENRP